MNKFRVSPGRLYLTLSRYNFLSCLAFKFGDIRPVGLVFLSPAAPLTQAPLLNRYSCNDVAPSQT